LGVIDPAILAHQGSPVLEWLDLSRDPAMNGIRTYQTSKYKFGNPP
jgi:hypothetical protein